MKWSLLWIGWLIMFSTARADDVYVASFNLGAIDRFNSNGIASAFANNINSPEQITFDASGNLYLANYGDGDVLKFTTNGIRSVFAAMAGGPNGLAFDRAGNLYVATFDGGTIEKYSAAGAHLATIATNLNHPIVLAFDSATNLYVSTYDNAVLLVATNGTTSVFVGGVNGPTGLAFDRDGNLYVANFWGNTITKFGRDGSLIGDLATNGLNQPYFIGFDSATNLYVANFGNNTVEKFVPSGAVTVFGTISSPSSLAVWPGLSLSVTNSVAVATDPASGLKLSRTAPGQMTLRFFGNTNQVFTVLMQTNPLAARSNWFALGAATLQASNLFQFVDIHATNVARYYVVRSP